MIKSCNSLLLPFLEKNALALPLALLGIDGCSVRYHDPRRGGGEGVREGAGRLAEGEKFNTARPGEEMTSQIRGRMLLKGLCDDSTGLWNMLVVEADAGHPEDELEAKVVRREPMPDSVRLPIGYAPGIGVLVEN